MTRSVVVLRPFKPHFLLCPSRTDSLLIGLSVLQSHSPVSLNELIDLSPAASSRHKLVKQNWQIMNAGHRSPQKRQKRAHASLPISSHPSSVDDSQPPQDLHTDTERQVQSALGNAGQAVAPRRNDEALWRLGLDFGTTQSCIAFTLPNFDPDKDTINTIEAFPGDFDPTLPGTQVPTLASYLLHANGKNNGDQSESSMPALLTYAGSRSAYNDTICPGYLHGYEALAQSRVFQPLQNDVPDGRVALMKLLLDNSAYTRTLRAKIRPIIDHLVQNGFIKKAEDVIRDYLTVMFLHTKKYLGDWYGFDSHSPDAMERAEIGISDDGFPPRLFMVNEAEAAATFALRARLHTLSRHETFVLLDCGGGTVDSGTFTVTNEEPMRLARVVTNPKGALCGANSLDEQMRLFAKTHLKDETYLERPDEGITIDTIIESAIMPEFERRVKRTFDPKDKDKQYVFYVQSLRSRKQGDPEYRRFRKHHFVLSYEDMEKIFRPALQGIAKLMEDQIAEADGMEGAEVDKVVVVGGFADSTALRLELREKLARINERRATRIRLVVAEGNVYGTCATGVAKGALLRALDKTNGPQHIPEMSYGHLVHLPFDKRRKILNKYPYLRGPTAEGTVTKNTIDKKLWIEDTIKWDIKKGQGPLATCHVAHFVQSYVFESLDEDWTQTEDLYASDICTEDFYQTTSPRNMGKFITVGKIGLDLNRLKDYVKPTRGAKNKPLFKVEVRVELVVVDRNLEFTVRWPSSEDGDVLDVTKGSQYRFSMVAAFEPGTAQV